MLGFQIESVLDEVLAGPIRARDDFREFGDQAGCHSHQACGCSRLILQVIGAIDSDISRDRERANVLGVGRIDHI